VLDPLLINGLTKLHRRLPLLSGAHTWPTPPHRPSLQLGHPAGLKRYRATASAKVKGEHLLGINKPAGGRRDRKRQRKPLLLAHIQTQTPSVLSLCHALPKEHFLLILWFNRSNFSKSISISSIPNAIFLSTFHLFPRPLFRCVSLPLCVSSCLSLFQSLALFLFLFLSTSQFLSSSPSNSLSPSSSLFLPLSLSSSSTLSISPSFCAGRHPKADGQREQMLPTDGTKQTAGPKQTNCFVGGGTITRPMRGNLPQLMSALTQGCNTDL